MTQIFRVTWISVEGGARITMNGRPVGPVIDEALADPLVGWFTGYLEQKTLETAERLGFDTSAVVAQRHTVPGGRCPSCGKGPGIVADVTENPCPVCRQ